MHYIRRTVPPAPTGEAHRVFLSALTAVGHQCCMATLLRPALRYSPTSVPSQEAAEGGGDAGLDYVANLLQSIVQATRVPVTSSHDQHTVHRGSNAQCDELHLVHLPIGGSSNPKIAEIQQLIDVLARRLWLSLIHI